MLCCEALVIVQSECICTELEVRENGLIGDFFFVKVQFIPPLTLHTIWHLFPSLLQAYYNLMALLILMPKLFCFILAYDKISQESGDSFYIK